MKSLYEIVPIVDICIMATFSLKILMCNAYQEFANVQFQVKSLAKSYQVILKEFKADLI